MAKIKLYNQSDNTVVYQNIKIEPKRFGHFDESEWAEDSLANRSVTKYLISYNSYEKKIQSENDLRMQECDVKELTREELIEKEIREIEKEEERRRMDVAIKKRNEEEKRMQKEIREEAFKLYNDKQGKQNKQSKQDKQENKQEEVDKTVQEKINIEEYGN